MISLFYSNTGMGSGKTSQALDYLRNKPSFIWMTPLETLAQNTQHRLEECNITVNIIKILLTEKISL